MKTIANYSRTQQIEEAQKDCFDAVVVGGGITGSGIVRDLAMRGLKSLLIEKGDFASGTSSKSGKLVHGGLRYLKYFFLHLVYESCIERSRLYKKIAPHIVKPVSFLYPFYKQNKTPRLLVFLGLMLYDALSFFRNGNPLHLVSRKRLHEMEPHIRQEDSTGALCFRDCTCLDARLVIDTLKSASEKGAILLPYCELLKLEFLADGIIILHACDRISGQKCEFKTKVVINAGGAWADDILEMAQTKERFGVKITRGIHIIFKKERLPLNHTLTIESVSDVRYLYAVPWGEHVLVGTTDKYYEGSKDRIPVSSDEVQYLLNSLNYYFPQAHLTQQDVVASYSGIRPLIGSDKGKKEEAVSRDYSILLDPRGLVSISGGKLTTYRSMSEKIVNKTIKAFFPNRKISRCQTVSPLSGGEKISMPIAQIAEQFQCKEGLVAYLIRRYGSNYHSILEIIQSAPEKAERVEKDTPLLAAEIEYFVKEEFVEKLSDIMYRRTQLALLSPQNGAKAVEPIARYLGKLKSWDEKRIEKEIEEYKKETLSAIL